MRFCQDLDKGLGERLIKSNRRAGELGVQRETRGTFKGKVPMFRVSLPWFSFCWFFAHLLCPLRQDRMQRRLALKP